MSIARSCLIFLGAMALVGSFAGCGSGGPEAFAPGSAPAVAPPSTSTHEPLGQAGPGPTPRKRSKKGVYQTQGPREQP